MATLREHNRARAGADAATLNREYDFVRLGDLISLTFCQPWLDPQAHGAYRITGDGRDLVVQPDPFDGLEVAFTIRARRLPNRAYADAADVRTAWNGAEITMIEGTIRGQ